MRLVIILENPHAVYPAKTTKETAPSAEYHGPRFETSIREVCWVGAASDGGIWFLGLGFFFDVSVGRDLGFGEDVGFGLVVFGVY